MVDAVYIHIPFCKNICHYCDFPKVFYNKELADLYLKSLEEEIKDKYKNEEINTIYIGGGTPSILNDEQLDKLYNIIKLFNLSTDFEFTIESNVDEMTESKILKHINNHVNRISIGIETFNQKHLNYLGRKQTLSSSDIVSKTNLLGLNNINIDMMYSFNNQTLAELNEDLDELIKLNPNHISYYSLIIEEHTKLYINKDKNVLEDLEVLMYETIINRLKDAGYIHYELSNFAKRGFESKHNLKYWDNLEYYGFGLGACSYLQKVRIYNTKNIDNYINKLYIKEEIIEDKTLQLENYLMLGLRKVKGINILAINQLYNIDILNNLMVKELITNKLLIVEDNNLFISYDKLYISNYILEKLMEVFNE